MGLIELCAPGLALAAPSVIPTPFDEDGYSITAALAPQSCLVVSGIDLRTMVARTADLQSKGLIRNDVDAGHVRAHAWTTAAMIALKLEPLFVATIYRQYPKIDSCEFGQAFVDFNGKVNIGYSFTMTRAIYDKQNWSAFVATDLPNVAQDFTLGPVTVQHMNAEAKLPD